MSAQDRMIHVEMYLAAVARLAARALGAGVRVTLTAQPDGVLRFDVTDEAGVVCRVAWGGGATTPEDAPETANLGFVTLMQGEGERAEAILAALRQVCHRIAQDARFAPVCLFNREKTRLPLDDDAMDLILSRRVSPGLTKVAGFTFLRADEEEGPSYSLYFENEDNFLLVAHLALPDASPFPLLDSVGPFSFSLLMATRREETPKPLPSLEALKEQPGLAALVAFLLFLLKRSLHDGLVPILPAPKSSPKSLEDRGQKRPDADSATATWRSDDGGSWRRFLFPYEIEHDATGDANVMGDHTFLEHGELECNYVQVFGQGKVRNHLPIWETDYRGPLVNLNPSPNTPDGPASPRSFYTYLGEQDLISGALDKLSDTLSYIREHDLQQGPLLFNDTCVARLLGEDMGMVLAEHERLSGKPVLTLDKTYTSHAGMQAHFFRQTLARAEDIITARGARELEPNSYALIGYPPDRSLEELVDILAWAGARLNAILVPRMGLYELVRAMNSRVFVVTPFPGWKDIFEKVPFSYSQPRITPELPYGLARSRDWVGGILETLGIDLTSWPEDDHARISDAVAQHREGIHGKLGLGFVVDEREVERLVTPAALYGVPLLPVLAEFGFSLTFFLFTHDPEQDIPATRDALRPVVGEDAALNLVPFSDKRELADALARDDTAQAVYSQFSFDTRLLSAGKATFSLIDLERGFEGAVRSIARLKERCLWRGPARFGRHLNPKGWLT